MVEKIASEWVSMSIILPIAQDKWISQRATALHTSKAAIVRQIIQQAMSIDKKGKHHHGR